MLYSGLTDFRYGCQKSVIDSFVYLLLIVVRQLESTARQNWVVIQAVVRHDPVESK